MSTYQSTKVIELGSCAFRQWRASHSHCRFLHGYQLKAKLWFGASSLDEKNWVVDFGGLKELKAKLNYIFDHTVTVAADDPELEAFKELDSKGIIQLRIMKKGVGIERVAEEVYRVAQEHIATATNNRCWVDRVEVFEHEDNSATFSNEKPLMMSMSPPGYIPEQNSDRLSELENNLQPTEEQPQVSSGDTDVAPNRGARIGTHVTQGMGNPFAGTSWG